MPRGTTQIEALFLERRAMTSGDLPSAFLAFRELVEVHLQKVLGIPNKYPMQAAALLVVATIEAISKLVARARPEDYFAVEFLDRHGVPVNVGRDLFDSLRNGLAHVYSP